jgi:iron complex outermembrane recepter protein
MVEHEYGIGGCYSAAPRGFHDKNDSQLILNFGGRLVMSNWVEKYNSPRELKRLGQALIGAVILVVSYAGSREAAAQSADASQLPAVRGADGSELQEVVVTARRRSENLENVPVAVSVLGSAQLTEEGVSTQADLQTAVPGLTVRPTEQQNQLSYSIRGQGVDAFSQSRPAVLPYINDVQVNTNSASSLYDLDSVQVLKGPQGTLFGRNATGGAVLFSTTKPSNDFGGYATVSFGNYGLKETQAAVDLPLVSDKVLLRIAGDIEDERGYQRDIFNGTDLGAVSRRSIRATLVIRPFDGLENTTVYEWDSAGGNNLGLEVHSVYPVGATHNGVPLADAVASEYGPILDKTIGVPGAWNAFLAAHPNAPPGGIVAWQAQQSALGPWVTDTDYPSLHSATSNYVANTTTYDFNSDTRIKNIMGFANSATHDLTDLDGSPYPIEEEYNINGTNSGPVMDVQQVSDELQLLGKTLNNKLDYIIGVYYALETDRDIVDLDVFNLVPVFPTPVADDSDYQTRDQTEAIYFQGTYALGDLTGLDGLSVTAGFRYSWEELHFDQLPLSTRQAPAEFAKFSDPSWQDGLEYQLNHDLLLYVENRGSWRGGGFNGAAPAIPTTAAGGGNLFLPETTYDVELGAKYQGTLFDKPALLNVAIYNQWIHNVQRVVYISINGAISAVTANVPAAVVRGVELEGRINPTKWLEIGGNVAFTAAEFSSASVELFGSLNTFGPYPDTPRVAGTAYASVRLPVSHELGDMAVRGEIYSQTNQFFSSQNSSVSPETSLGGYSLLNFRYDWHNIAETKLSVAAYVKNATNKGYFVGGLAQGATFGLNTVLPGLPRMYGMELNYKF